MVRQRTAGSNSVHTSATARSAARDRLGLLFLGVKIPGQAGTLLLKVAERRATLLGMNAPQGHAVQIIQHEPAAAQTSTDKIRAAIDRIRGRALPKPESGDPDKLS